jgi:hypothetical protein
MQRGCCISAPAPHSQTCWCSSHSTVLYQWMNPMKQTSPCFQFWKSFCQNCECPTASACACIRPYSRGNTANSPSLTPECTYKQHAPLQPWYTTEQFIVMAYDCHLMRCDINCSRAVYSVLRDLHKWFSRTGESVKCLWLNMQKVICQFHRKHLSELSTNLLINLHISYTEDVMFFWNIYKPDYIHVRFAVFTAVTMKSAIFWDVVPRFRRNIHSYKSHMA